MTGRGAENPNWRGGRIRGPEGRWMIYAPEHPYPNSLGVYVLQYRLIAEQMLGRYLTPDEIVHHINGNPHDNRPENLEVMTQAEHARLHIASRRDPVTGRITSHDPAVGQTWQCAICDRPYRQRRAGQEVCEDRDCRRTVSAWKRYCAKKGRAA